MGMVFNGSSPNLNAAVNRLNRMVTYSQNTSSSLAAGGGGVAPNANVEKAVQWALNKAATRSISYSMYNRHLKEPNEWSYDCSSFVITAYYVGGFDINAGSTANMRSGFTSAGFIWIPGSTFPASTLQRGDILLCESRGPGNGHTQMYVGNNQDVNCGGSQDLLQDHVDYFSYGGWDGVLRYAGA